MRILRNLSLALKPGPWRSVTDDLDLGLGRGQVTTGLNHQLLLLVNQFGSFSGSLGTSLTKLDAGCLDLCRQQKQVYYTFQLVLIFILLYHSCAAKIPESRFLFTYANIWNSHRGKIKQTSGRGNDRLHIYVNDFAQTNSFSL